MPPSLLVACLVAAGTAAGVLADPPLARWAPPVAVAAGAAGLIAHAGRQHWLRRTLLAAALAAAATANGASAVDHAERSPLVRWLDLHAAGARLDEPVLLEGTLLQDAAPVDGGALLRLGVSRAATLGAPEPVPGGVTLTVTGGMVAQHMDAWRAGRVVRLPAVLRRPARYLNVGVADGERALARRGSSHRGTVKSAALVEVTARGWWWDEVAARARATVRRAMDRHVGRHDPVAGAIGTAILIGDRAAVPLEVEQRLQQAGTYHVVAISGGNIALLAGAVVAVLWVLRIRFAWAAALAIVMLVAHAWTIGSGPSVIRATAMAVLYLALRLIDQRTAPANAVALGAAGMLLARPLDIVDAGFWLTFGASAALIGAASRWPQQHRPGWHAPLVICLGTIAVELVLTPVSAYVFQRVTMAGLLLNLAAIPSMAGVQASGTATVLAAAAGWPGVADLLGRVTWVLAMVLVESARLVDLAPWTTWRVPSPSWTVMTAYYACLAAWWRVSRPPLDTRARRLTARAGLAAALALWTWIAVAPQARVRALGDGRLHVTMMDVGQGEALLVQFPNGRTLMVDGGGVAGAPGFDMGDRVLGPALRARGIVRLDYLALTHSHPDHIGGTLTLVREFGPVEIWAGVPVPNDEPTARLRDIARTARAGWRWLQRGDRMEVGDVELRVHHPPPPDWERQRVRNDDSLVLELRLGDVSLLLTGDIGREVEQELLPRLDPLPFTILNAPHHGSATSSSAELLHHLRPRAVLVSAGRANLYGHPAPAVLARYAHAEAEVFRTDADGEIHLATDGREVTVQTFTGRTVDLKVRRDEGGHEGNLEGGGRLRSPHLPRTFPEPSPHLPETRRSRRDEAGHEGNMDGGRTVDTKATKGRRRARRKPEGGGDMLTRVRPALDAETERLVERTIGCAIEVHRVLGPGYLEGIYQDALAIELDYVGLAFEREVPITLTYRGRPLRGHRLDLVVGGRVLLELKSVEQLAPVHYAQVGSYLKAAGLRVGLLMNFNKPTLVSALKRIVL